MTALPNKKLIEKRFRRALTTYDFHSEVQQSMADKLTKLILTYGHSYPLIFEVGSGSGYLTALLSEELEYREFYVNDLVKEALRFLPDKEGLRFIAGDIEKIALPFEIDLFVSNACLQWLHKPASFFKKIFPLIKHGGLLAFTSFAPGQYVEISELTGQSLDYLSSSAYRMLLEGAGFEIVKITEEEWKREFPSPRAVLEHMKHTGVNAMKSPNWGKNAYRQFCDDYLQRFSSPGGVTLSYHPLWLIAKK